VLLLLVGAAVLLYPLSLSYPELVAIGSFATNGPISAIALVVCGVALLVFAQNRRGMREPPFALDLKESTLYEKIVDLVTLRFFIDTWREIDAEAASERAERIASGRGGYDWRPLVALVSGAAFLSIMEYYGHAPTLHRIYDHYDPLGDRVPATGFMEIVRHSPFVRLFDFVWWSGWRVLGFFLLPALVIKLVLREDLSDYGLQTAGFLKHAWIYLLFFGIVLVAVVVVSFEEGFKNYYPFYEDADRSWYDFWTWELLYAAQFFSLEFFFRGFWLKAAKRAMGSHAIWAMVVPYCMIHFGKPFLETLAAILAGVALGTLALRTRSIWSGFLIHVSVAISMDLAATMQKTGLPDRWWPAFH
jgi:membrane protease YdiL (CAAX protease family)